MKNIKVSAPGKIILSGEHAVVYGYPALVTAVNKRLHIALSGGKTQIDSEIPIGCGMGSSAAYAVAVSALKLGKLNLAKINEMAYKMEKKFHGNPSGVDPAISTYGGFLWYRKEAEGLKNFSRPTLRRKLPKLFLINTGKPEETTAEMVAMVGEYAKKHPARASAIFRGIEAVTRHFLKFLLKEENLALNDLIKDNERLLESLGVVSPSAQELIRRIEKTGGAAKIAGAGGRKGASGILIAYHQSPQRLQAFAKKNSLKLLRVKLGAEGVRYER